MHPENLMGAQGASCQGAASCIVLCSWPHPSSSAQQRSNQMHAYLTNDALAAAAHTPCAPQPQLALAVPCLHLHTIPSLHKTAKHQAPRLPRAHPSTPHRHAAQMYLCTLQLQPKSTDACTLHTCASSPDRKQHAGARQALKNSRPLHHNTR